jgi:hypothetical protein
MISITKFSYVYDLCVLNDLAKRDRRKGMRFPGNTVRGANPIYSLTFPKATRGLVPII